jgi:hypothetical protein
MNKKDPDYKNVDLDAKVNLKNLNLNVKIEVIEKLLELMKTS